MIQPTLPTRAGIVRLHHPRRFRIDVVNRAFFVVELDKEYRKGALMMPVEVVSLVVGYDTGLSNFRLIHGGAGAAAHPPQDCARIELKGTPPRSWLGND